MKKKRSFIYRIYREKDIKKTESKINLFGVSKKFDAEYFMNFRLYTSILVFVVIFLFVDSGALLAPIISVLWYFLVNYLMIDRPLKKRETKLNNEAYYYFEVLTLALESGRNLENAIKMGFTI